tara:strand:+ start:7522 stop:7659 length:138 start_codon:yes stop_codon:yes gene_type:complete
VWGGCGQIVVLVLIVVMAGAFMIQKPPKVNQNDVARRRPTPATRD